MSQLVASPVVAPLAGVRALVAHTDDGSNRCPVISHISIMAGELCVATATLGGKYSEDQALRAFNGRDRQRFKIRH